MKWFSINPFRRERRRQAGFRTRRAAHLRLGRRGERLACRLLGALGLEILARNFSGTRGEIDIVARESDTLCFIEVKTRHRVYRARPAAAVGSAKRRNLVRAAHQFLREIGNPPVNYRFDIVEALLDRWQVRDIRYYRNAFTEEDVHRAAADRFPDAGTPAGDAGT